MHRNNHVQHNTALKITVIIKWGNLESSSSHVRYERRGTLFVEILKSDFIRFYPVLGTDVGSSGTCKRENMVFIPFSNGKGSVWGF